MPKQTLKPKMDQKVYVTQTMVDGRTKKFREGYVDALLSTQFVFTDIETGARVFVSYDEHWT